MVKIKYGLDPHNRFILKETAQKSSFPRFRQVVDGRFKIDKNNTLTYHVKSPASKDINIPNQLKIKGKWALNKNHDLSLAVDKQTRKTFGDKLILKGNIVKINKNSLYFAVTTKTKKGVQSVYVLNLKGSWRADKYNRLTFTARKEKGRTDILTFDGAWDISKNYRIIYKYKKSRLVRKKKKVHTLIFNGWWRISRNLRISYFIDKTSDSGFTFKAVTGIVKKDRLKYELGIKLSNKRKIIKRTLTFFGRWKIRKNTISLKLTNPSGKDTGLELKLSRNVFKRNGEAFIRFLKNDRKTAIFTGAVWRW